MSFYWMFIIMVVGVSFVIILISAIYLKENTKPLKCPECRGSIFYEYKSDGCKCEKCEKIYSIDDCLEMIRIDYI